MDAIAKCCTEERQLLDLGSRSNREFVNDLLHHDFMEIGASGRQCSRQEAIDELAGADTSLTITESDMVGRRIANDVVLVTYQTSSGGRVALRNSIWVLDGHRWLLMFHQGTIVA